MSQMMLMRENNDSKRDTEYSEIKTVSILKHHNFERHSSIHLFVNINVLNRTKVL